MFNYLEILTPWDWVWLVWLCCRYEDESSHWYTV